MQRSLDLLALTKRLEMISTKPAVGRHFFRRLEFKGEKRRRSQAFYTGTSCLMAAPLYSIEVSTIFCLNMAKRVKHLCLQRILGYPLVKILAEIRNQLPKQK